MSDKCRIIMYHYVREIKESRYPGIKGLEYSQFCEQLEFLLKNFSFIRMEDLMEQADGTRDRLPENACLLTFDDGYMDHYEYVYPLLRKYGVQGSFFVPGKILKEDAVLDVNKIHFILACGNLEKVIGRISELLDGFRKGGEPLPSDGELFKKLAKANRFDSKEVIFVKRLLQNELPEHVRAAVTAKLFEECVQTGEEEFSRKLYMRMPQMEEMKRDGMFFGHHSYSHCWLGKIPEEQMKQEIDRGLEILRPVLDPENWVMNFPYGTRGGAYSDCIVSYIRERGCSLGLTTIAKTAELLSDDRYLLPRFDTNDFPPKSMNYQKVENSIS